MREIAFKAKEIDTGDWVYGYLVRIHEDDYRIVTEDDLSYAYTGGYDYDGTMTKIDKNTICQYTGLTDKNCNKIWENDVVQYDFGEYMLGIQKAIIQYSNKYHGYKINPINDWSYTNIEDCEVIGNIFDNPELLEGGE